MARQRTPTTALILFSGGLDSTLALAWALRRGYTPILLEFETPKRPPGERKAADAIARHYGRPERIQLTWPNETAPQRDGYIPSRNLVLHALGYAVAEAHGIPLLVAGHLRSDDFPDATRSYLQAIQRLANRGRTPAARTRLALPLFDQTPPERARQARAWGVPIGLTWSCWWGPLRPCGRCQKCRERARLTRSPSSAAKPRNGPRRRPG